MFDEGNPDTVTVPSRGRWKMVQQPLGYVDRCVCFLINVCSI